MSRRLEGVWLICCMVLIKLGAIKGTMYGKAVKVMVWELVCLGNNFFFQAEDGRRDHA